MTNYPMSLPHRYIHAMRRLGKDDNIIIIQADKARLSARREDFQQGTHLQAASWRPVWITLSQQNNNACMYSCSSFQRVKISSDSSSLLMCFRCQRYGRHQSSYRMQARCGVFGGFHLSQSWLAWLKAGERVPPYCIHCGGKHHTWHKRHFVLLNKILTTNIRHA